MKAVLILFTSILVYVEGEDVCTIGNRQYYNGQQFDSDDGNYILKCNIYHNGWGTVPVGCITEKKQRIMAGNSVQEGQYKWECKDQGGGYIFRNWFYHPTECQIKNDNGRQLTYSNGEEFDYGVRRLKCVVNEKNFQFKGVACYTEKGKRIELDGTAEEDDGDYIWTYKCKDTGGWPERSRSYRRKPPTTCKVNYRDYKDGEEMDSSDGMFILKCFINEDGSGVKPVACYTEKKQRVDIGQAVQEGQFKWFCIDKGGGSVARRWKYYPTVCETRDEQGSKVVYNNGEEFDSGKNRLKCVVENGSERFIGVACYTDKGKRIDFGQTVEEDDRNMIWTYKCHDTGALPHRTMEYRYKPPTVCKMNGKEYKNGEEFKSSNGRYEQRCVIEGFSIILKRVACYTDQGQKIQIGQRIKEGQYTYECHLEGENARRGQSYNMNE